MKIRELAYEWCLFCANFMGGGDKQGFFDNKRIYIKNSWLDWTVKEISKMSIKELKSAVEGGK